MNTHSMSQTVFQAPFARDLVNYIICKQRGTAEVNSLIPQPCSRGNFRVIQHGALTRAHRGDGQQGAPGRPGQNWAPAYESVMRREKR